MNITNDLVTEYINGFYLPLDEELSELRKSAEERKVPVILRETESLLGFIFRFLKPERVLEIGTAVGYSAAFFIRSGAQKVPRRKPIRRGGKYRVSTRKRRKNDLRSRAGR